MNDDAFAKSSGSLAVSETLSMPRSFTHGNREIPAVPHLGNRRGTGGEGSRLTATMHAVGKSDEGVVPMNHRRPTGRGRVREGLKPEGLRPMTGIGTLRPVHAMSRTTQA